MLGRARGRAPVRQVLLQCTNFRDEVSTYCLSIKPGSRERRSAVAASTGP